MLTNSLALDQVSVRTTSSQKHLDSADNTIASNKPPCGFKGFRPGMGYVAEESMKAFQQAAIALFEAAWKMGEVALRMKNDLRRNEYQMFLLNIGWTTKKVNKYARIVKVFEGFEPLTLAKIELTTLFTLCGKAYSGVVEQMRQMSDISQSVVEKLIKESRKKGHFKTLNEPISGWKQNPSGGGRHYSVILHDEETGVRIENLAEQEKVLPQRIIADAIAVYKPTAEASTHQMFQIGDKVEIQTERKGQDFVWQIGSVTAATNIGCVVEIAGDLHYFYPEELVRVIKN